MPTTTSARIDRVSQWTIVKASVPDQIPLWDCLADQSDLRLVAPVLASHSRCESLQSFSVVMAAMAA